MIYKLIYLIGERIKNPLIREYYNTLMKSDFNSEKEIREKQLGQLKKLLLHAKEYSPFYKNRFDKINIEKMSLDDIELIPFLTREELRLSSQFIQNNPFNEKLVKSKSSGSTSKALIFGRNKEWEAAHRAAQLRGYSWYGINPWDKNLYFWGFSPQWRDLFKIKIFDLLMNRTRIFSYKDNDLAKVARTLDTCKYVEGYSSSIFALAQYLNKHNKDYKNIKIVKGTSEKIFDYYQEPIKKVFNTKMISEYGAAEAGIIAFECPEGNMHISMENLIVEEIEGKIYITNLFSTSFPIIRYELGDQIVLEKNEKCKCGREHHIIKEVIGRIGQIIEGINESYPTATLSYISKSLADKHNLKIAYFGKQYEKGKLLLDVICEMEDKVTAKETILRVAKEYFSNDLLIDVNFIAKIERGNKKITYFESYINKDLDKQEQS